MKVARGLGILAAFMALTAGSVWGDDGKNGRDPVSPPVPPVETTFPTTPPAAPAASGGSIKVEDTTDPADDLLLQFGIVPVGLARRQAILVSNEGTGDLQLGLIAAGSLDGQFSVVGPAENRQDCSERLLRPAQSCLILVHFRPAAAENYGRELIIPSDDPSRSEVVVELAGAGGPPTADFPAPQLIHPDPGQAYLESTVNFRWYTCWDVNGRPASYRLYCSQDPAFADTNPRRLADSALQLAGAGLGVFLLLTWRRRRGTNALLTVILLAAWLLVACSEDIEESTTGSIGGLESESTYYWKVVAEYEDGLEAESEVRTFTTR